MKTTTKLFGIIALVVVIGFGVTSCDWLLDALDTGVTITGSDRVVKGETATYTAVVKDSPDQSVVWTIDENSRHSGTTISEGGVLSVAAAETLKSLTIRAASTADIGKYGTKTVTLADAAGPGPGPGPGENLSVVYRDVGYTPVNSFDSKGNNYNYSYYRWLRPFNNYTPIIMTWVGADGSVSVCSPSDSRAYVYEYTSDMQYVKTVQFDNELATLGAFAKDTDGSYYLFYGKDVEEAETETENMAMVKYNSSGSKVNTYRLKAEAPNSFRGIKKPFDAGACRMEISGNMVTVYFAREMFKSPDGLNHQSSYGFVLNKDTFARVDSGAASSPSTLDHTRMPYVSHSFNQFILPVADGFVFADHGDANVTRAFTFAKFQNDANTKRITAFNFKGGGVSYGGSATDMGYNYTFAQMGGLAKTANGYIFAGTYEKNNAASANLNDSRNLFIMTFDEGLTGISAPVWITAYTDKDEENAANPKIAGLDGGRYLLLWELMSGGSDGYQTTYAAVIDGTGKALTAVKELPDARLNVNDALRYNKQTGNVHWAVNTPEGKIAVYSYKPE